MLDSSNTKVLGGTVEPLCKELEEKKNKANKKVDLVPPKPAADPFNDEAPSKIMKTTINQEYPPAVARPNLSASPYFVSSPPITTVAKPTPNNNVNNNKYSNNSSSTVDRMDEIRPNTVKNNPQVLSTIAPPPVISRAVVSYPKTNIKMNLTNNNNGFTNQNSKNSISSGTVVNLNNNAAQTSKTSNIIPSIVNNVNDNNSSNSKNMTIYEDVDVIDLNDIYDDAETTSPFEYLVDVVKNINTNSTCFVKAAIINVPMHYDESSPADIDDGTHVLQVLLSRTAVNALQLDKSKKISESLMQIEGTMRIRFASGRLPTVEKIIVNDEETDIQYINQLLRSSSSFADVLKPTSTGSETLIVYFSYSSYEDKAAVGAFINEDCVLNFARLYPDENCTERKLQAFGVREILLMIPGNLEIRTQSKALVDFMNEIFPVWHRKKHFPILPELWQEVSSLISERGRIPQFTLAGLDDSNQLDEASLLAQLRIFDEKCE